MIDVKEIKNVSNIGTLHGQEVKYVETLGGLHLAFGCEKSEKNPKALTAASHRGILLHQLEKTYGNQFKPAINKSETDYSTNILSFSDLLPQQIYNLGYDIYSIEENNYISFSLTKHNIEMVSQEYILRKDEIIFHNTNTKNENLLTYLNKAAVKYGELYNLEVREK